MACGELSCIWALIQLLMGAFFGLLPCPTVVVEPQGNSVEQVDHDRGERIEGDCEVLIGGETEVSSEGNTEILPGGTEAVVGDTEEQIEAYTEGVNGEGHSGTG